MLDTLVDVLGLDREHVRTLVAEDNLRFEQDWQRWADEPVEPQLRFRPFAGLWCGDSLPGTLSHEQAVAFARTRAAERRMVYVLVWSRKDEVWCYPDGTTHRQTMKVGEAAGPVTRLRGRGNRGFVFG
jgi:hypothetical protein